jgi:hypothetical protein
LFWSDPNAKVNNPMLKKIRQYEYADIKGKKVLCLASGGGQGEKSGSDGDWDKIIGIMN